MRQGLANRRRMVGALLGSAALGGFAGPRRAHAMAGSAERLRGTVDPIADHGVDPTGTEDTTLRLQAALSAAGGGVLHLPAGDYRLSATLRVPSHTIVRGSGPGTRFFTQSERGFAFISNPNFDVDYTHPVPDRDIAVEDIFFDYGALKDGRTHAVSFRMAQNVGVRGCYFAGGNDATAMLACTNSLVEGCYATGIDNCAYDHWDGCRDFTVRGCYASMSGGNGLLATGAPTRGSAARTTEGGLFEDCEIHGGGVGLYMNAAAANSAVVNVTARNLRFYGTRGGVVMDGVGGQHTIDGIHWIGGGIGKGIGKGIGRGIGGGSGGGSGGAKAAKGDCAIRTSPANGSGPPSDCFFDNIHVVNSATAGGNVGMIQLGGLRHTLGKVNLVGAAIRGGTLIWAPTPASGSVVNGPITADPATLAKITYGLFQGNTNSVRDSNLTLDCYDPFAGHDRFQGPAAPSFEAGLTVAKNGALALTNQRSGRGSRVATLRNAPAPGDPAFWVPIVVNGTTRHFPVW